MPASIEEHPLPGYTAGRPMVERSWLFTILLASVLCLAYVVAMVIQWGDIPGRSLYANLGMIPIGLVATILASKAATSRSDRSSLWAWRALAAGLACLWAGDVLDLVYQNVLGRSAFPSLADAGHLAYYPLVFAGLLLLPRGSAHRLRRMFAYPILLVLMAGGAGAILVWFLLPTLHSSHDGLFAYCLSVGYPFGDLLLLGGMAWMLSRGAWTHRWSVWLLSLGLLIGLLADGLFGYQSVQGSAQSGGLADVAHMLSWTSFAWAGYAELVGKEPAAAGGREGRG